MTKMVKFQMITVCCSLLFVSACEQVAITGRKQFNLVPDMVMNSMSFQSYAEFLTQNKTKLSSSAQQVEMVKGIGLRIQKAVEQYCAENGLSPQLKGYNWEFNLVDDPNINAWCMPGGKVVVYTGLLPISQNEAGLAVVMGHEIAHAIAKHGAERMTQGLIIEMGGMALSTALAKRPEETKNLFMRSYGVGTQYGILLPYSRVHETEADHLGLIFMAMAGYDPHEAVGFWERMTAANKGGSPPELLSTHPSDATRIKNIKAFMPEAMQYYH
ncbi:MAG TPA: M48 family metallopeptidase [Sedimentisphaerales bacterium]|nr:M48 family metallopeptidase [Sedimentisphaerales bacterium]